MSIKPRRRSVLEDIAAERSSKSKVQQNGNDSKSSAAEFENQDVEIGSVETLRRGPLGREIRSPLLQTSVDLSALDEERETCSPIDTRITRGRSSFSPRTCSSPISFPSLSDFGSLSSAQDRPASPRTTSYTSSVGWRSRRDTARSGSSSWSAASMFLSQFSRRDDVAAASPIDEGQEIGVSPKYVIGREVGYGGFSVIKEVLTIEDGERVKRAVKIVLKHINGKSEQESETLQHNFEHEAHIWRLLKHPYILPLIDVYETSYATFCITQLNTGGTLHDLVSTLRKHNKPASSNSTSPTTAASNNSFPPATKRLPLHLKKRYLYQLAHALRYLHRDLYIVHRDIKLENCLLNLSSSAQSSQLSSEDASMTGNLLLCDFGMADFISHDSRDPSPPRPANPTTTANIAGSLEYAAPEALSSPSPSSLYHPSTDMWAFGVVSYALLTLKLPFDHDLKSKLPAMIQACEWDVAALRQAVEADVAAEDNDEDAAEVAVLAVKLVEGCLRKDVKKRWDVGRVLSCGFLQGCAELYDVEPGV